jgi:hypothetical protein
VNARVLIASDYNSKERAHFTLSYEFCQVIAQCEDADLIAPRVNNYIEKRLGRILPPHDKLNVQRDFNRLLNGVRKGLGLKNAPTVQAVDLDKEYELFVYIAWSPVALVELSRIRNWRQRCSKAVVFMHELWLSTIKENKAYLRILDQFDHVFLLHQASIPELQRYTSAPCSFMPTGTDCLLATPYPSAPERVIDVYSLGNRPAGLHKKLVALAENQEIFYLYDSLSSSDSRMKDWREHRLLVANNIKRSRYFIAFSPAAIATSKALQVRNEQVVPSRLFEGAAGGAVMIGEAPECPEFNELFDWPDAVIKIPTDPSDVRDLLKELDSQPARMDRLRKTNAINSLKRHDWVYRWEHMLKAVGLETSSKLHDRKDRLRRVAEAAERELEQANRPLAISTR